MVQAFDRRLHLPCCPSGRTQLRHVSGQRQRGRSPQTGAFRALGTSSRRLHPPPRAPIAGVSPDARSQTSGRVIGRMAKTKTTEAAKEQNRITDDPVFGYRALPGIADEMVDINGNVRPVWQHLLANIGRMDETELSNRFARADRYLRDAGVFYRAYGSKENSERSWPLSHVPVMIDEREWHALSNGLVQRADLLERLAAHL